MLSLRFDNDAEWWVSGKIFDRLFQAGLETGTIAPELEHWWHVANANGGLSFALLKPSEAQELAQALHKAAREELARLEQKDPTFEDETYQEGLSKLLNPA